MIIDLYAGAGGVSEGLRSLGRDDVLGVDVDALAVAIARAAGHKRLQADVYGLDPVKLRGEHGRPEGLHGSPPCGGLSSSGLGIGRSSTRSPRRPSSARASSGSPGGTTARTAAPTGHGTCARRTGRRSRSRRRSEAGPSTTACTPPGSSPSTRSGACRGFPAGYPWPTGDGDRSAAALRIANAVPPPLYAGIVAPLLDEAVPA